MNYSVLASNSLTKNTLDSRLTQQTYTRNSGLDTTYDEDDDSIISDCESANSRPAFDPSPSLGEGLISLHEGDKVYDIIKRRLILGLGALGRQTELVAIQRNSFPGLTGQARIQSFQIFTKALATKCGGDANVKYAWYSSTKDEICKITHHGFGCYGKPNNNGLYGSGIYLFPDDSPMEW